MGASGVVCADTESGAFVCWGISSGVMWGVCAETELGAFVCWGVSSEVTWGVCADTELGAIVCRWGVSSGVIWVVCADTELGAIVCRWDASSGVIWAVCADTELVVPSTLVSVWRAASLLSTLVTSGVKSLRVSTLCGTFTSVVFAGATEILVSGTF